MQACVVVDCFNCLFEGPFSTRLEGGEPEPFYRADPSGGGTIFFAHDYVSSALHEVAHWCVAGPARRRQDDYGYWYEGCRDLTQQKQFERMEVKPQALEWIFSEALGIPFRVSADNLTLAEYDKTPFRRAVQAAVQERLTQGLPPRAATFASALARVGQGRRYDKLDIYAELPA